MSAPICHYYFAEWGCKLLAPLTMVRHPMSEIMDATNGCGREGIEERLIPDTIWGLDISPVCRVHDWMYIDADTTEEENYADAIFGANLISLIKQKTKSRVLQWLRLRRAYKYVDAVALTNCVDVATLEVMGIKEMVC
jgi:hypothetical protein